jgi:hypothetical protein
MTQVHIEIERLVLNGLSAKDGHTVAGALREELNRLLSAPEVAQQLSRIVGAPVLRAANPALPTSTSPHELGVNAARAIGSELINEPGAS